MRRDIKAAGLVLQEEPSLVVRGRPPGAWQYLQGPSGAYLLGVPDRVPPRSCLTIHLRAARQAA